MIESLFRDIGQPAAENFRHVQQGQNLCQDAVAVDPARLGSKLQVSVQGTIKAVAEVVGRYGCGHVIDTGHHPRLLQ